MIDLGTIYTGEAVEMIEYTDQVGQSIDRRYEVDPKGIYYSILKC